MSTVKAAYHQVGLSATASQNCTWYTLSDGSYRLGVGNAGATTGDALVVSNTGALTLQSAGAPINNVSSINGGQLAGMRNRIINGNFDIWQRGTAFASGVAGQYGPDRWQVFREANAAGATFSRPTYGGNFEAGSTYALRLQRDVGNASTATIIAATSFETIDVYKLRGKTVTLSFWALAGANFSGGTFSASIFTGTGVDGNLYTGFTTAVPVAYVSGSGTAITKYSCTATIGGATIGQLGILIGYTPTGTAGASDYVEVTGVQLEVGSVATPFEQRPYGTELALCQRYYQVHSLYAPVAAYNGVNTFTLNTYSFPTMRLSPSIPSASTATPRFWTTWAATAYSANVINTFFPLSIAVDSVVFQQTLNVGGSTPVGAGAYTYEGGFTFTASAEL